MRELISLHLGQAGSQVGHSLWELLCQEHDIDLSGRCAYQRLEGDPFKSFFSETASNQYLPRAVFCDSDPQSQSAAVSRLFNPGDVLTYKQDAKSNFFEGRRQALEFHVVEAVMDRLRRQADLCDNLAGFYTFNSFGGGTGSALGVELLEDIKEAFGQKVQSFNPVVYPSFHFSSNVVEPYNSLFSTAYTRETADLAILLDNQGAYRLCKNELHIKKPSYIDLNKLIAEMVSGSTASLRFDSMLNASLTEITTNLVPEPNLHYCLLSLAPLDKFTDTTKQVVVDLFQPKSFLADVSQPRLLKDNRYLAASVLLRGQRLQAIEAIEAIKMLTNAGTRSYRDAVVRFPPWTPQGFKVGIVGAPAERGAVLLANTTAARALFVRNYEKFLKLFYHKAFVWQFLEAGGEMDLFYEAKELLVDLIQRYTDVITNCVNAETGSELAAL